jgi:hypothetical protein
MPVEGVVLGELLPVFGADLDGSGLFGGKDFLHAAVVLVQFDGSWGVWGTV